MAGKHVFMKSSSSSSSHSCSLSRTRTTRRNTTSRAVSSPTSPSSSSRSSSSPPCLPVIDVSALFSHERTTSSEYEAVCAELDAACRDTGFFYASGHNVDEKLVDGLRDVARDWFAFDSDFKRKFTLGPKTFYRGYQSLGDNVTRHEDGFTRDMHEAIDLYRPVAEDGNRHLSASGEGSILRPAIDSPLHGPNPTTFGFEPLDAMLDEYIEEMLRLSKAIMRGLATGYGVDEDAFIKAGVGDESYWVMRVINYPPLMSKVEGDDWNREIDKKIALSCGEHSDYGLLTLVNQDSNVEALQVQNRKGEWLFAPPLPNTFVCNIGDMLELMTNFEYKSTKHRVVNAHAGSQSRVSIPFFYEPNFDAVIEPLRKEDQNAEECAKAQATSRSFEILESAASGVDENTVAYGKHLTSKVLNNFELQD